MERNNYEVCTWTSEEQNMAQTLTAMLLLMILMLIVLVQGNTKVPSCGLYFTLNGIVYLPGDTVLITDIGEVTSNDPSKAVTSLVCRTELVNTNCCRPKDGRNVGEWFFPNGIMVPRNSGNEGANFTRSGSAHQVRLNRRNNALTPTGAFECRVPDSNETLVTASITLATADENTGYPPSASLPDCTTVPPENSEPTTADATSASTTNLPTVTNGSTAVTNAANASMPVSNNSGLIAGLMVLIIAIVTAITVAIIVIVVCVRRKHSKAKPGIKAFEITVNKSDPELAEQRTYEVVNEEDMRAIIVNETDGTIAREGTYEAIDEVGIKEGSMNDMGMENAEQITYEIIDEEDQKTGTQNVVSVEFAGDNDAGVSVVPGTTERMDETGELTQENTYDVLRGQTRRETIDSSIQLYSKLNKISPRPRVASEACSSIYSNVSKPDNVRAASSNDLYAVVDQTKKKPKRPKPYQTKD